MAQIEITINTDNIAFEDDESGEIQRILDTIKADGILDDISFIGEYSLRDINGNTVGQVRYNESFDDYDSDDDF